LHFRHYAWHRLGKSAARGRVSVRMTVARTPLAAEIERELTSWEAVEAHPHRFGGVEFRVGRRELGHLHGDRFADLPFPRRIRDELVAEGRARPHHVLPESGWVTVPIDDAAALIELFRIGYDRATAARARA
jgi:hypothetical protein